VLVHSRVRPVEALFGLALLILGIALAVGTANLPISPLYSRIGPTIVPTLVASASILVGLLLTLQALSDWRNPETVDAFHAIPLLVVVFGVVLHLLIITSLGYVIASTVLFAIVARAFSERRPVVAVGWGLALALVSYAGFKYGLDLTLPAGPLPF
jgi:hypothetical protein